MTQKDIADVIQDRLLEYDMTTSELASHAGVTFETASRVKKTELVMLRRLRGYWTCWTWN